MEPYTIHAIQVAPNLPKELEPLKELAYNLHWSWDHETRTLFRQLDSKLWEKVNRNPVRMLGSVDQQRLEKMAQNKGYIAFLARVKENVDDYMGRERWYQEHYGKTSDLRIGYFSMEYGLAVGLPIYSGGLGILAADHLKSAGDLGLPLVAVGLAYQKGYFKQYLGADGWQQETYPVNDFYNLPMTLEKDEKGRPILVAVQMPGRDVYAQIWRVQVGRVPLYLLDANIPRNNAGDRMITSQLYGGDAEMRIQQEILLGVGGLRALEALDAAPNVCHMNEGHAAFLSLERVRTYRQANADASFMQAREATRYGNVFTTHTPVPAGIDEFPPDLVEKYLGAYFEQLAISANELMALGGAHLPQTQGKLNMAIFAINMAGGYNGVSRLHGRVARRMWSYLWPGLPENEVPIGHVTNGVHVRTWLSSDLSELFIRYVDPNWHRRPSDETMWQNVDQIPDEELWRTHERRRERLVALARRRLQQRLQTIGASPSDIKRAAEVLNPEALTIGFARRFASYKRAHLLFSDPERLRKILSDPKRPVQIIIAGKAHPKDKIGKEIIKTIISIIHEEDFRDKIVFLENYDMKIASYMVQGVDVWLNNPRRPREASGTSGMKASANGALNLSILDGWWDEAYEMNQNIGWAIGMGEENYNSAEEQDEVESKELYHLLENEVIPTFYARGKSSAPRTWIEMMKTNMKVVCPFFNTNRMVLSYFSSYYTPAFEDWKKTSNEGGKTAKKIVEFQERVLKNWDAVEIIAVDAPASATSMIGEKLLVSAQVKAGGLKPEELLVQLYFGRVDDKGHLENAKVLPMSLSGSKTGDSLKFAAEVELKSSGQHGYSVRVQPHHPVADAPVQMGFIKWFVS